MYIFVFEGSFFVMKRFCRFLAVFLSLVLVLGGVGELPVRASTAFDLDPLIILNPVGHGTISGVVITDGVSSPFDANRRIPLGSSITFTHTANQGYVFYQWQVNNVISPSTNPPVTAGPGTNQITIGPLSDAHVNLATNQVVVTARFHQQTTTPPIRRTVRVYSNVVNSSEPAALVQNRTNDYAQGDTVPLYAPFRAGYSFEGWALVPPTTGITIAFQYYRSTTFIMPDPAIDVSVVANWRRLGPAPVARTISISNLPPVDNFNPAPVLGQTTSPHLRYPGDTLPLEAGSRDGFRFTGWIVQPSSATVTHPGSAAATLTLPANLNDNVIVTANWEPIDATLHQVTIANMPGGSVFGQSATPVSEVAGQQVTIITPMQRYIYVNGISHSYRFIGWELPPTVHFIGDNASPNIQFTMPNSHVIATARWARDGVPMRIVEVRDIAQVGSELGTVSLNRPVGEQVTINAGTRTGWTFTHWTVESTDTVSIVAATSSSTTFVMPPGSGNIVVRAHWRRNTNLINIINFPANATITGQGVFTNTTGTPQAPEGFNPGVTVHIDAGTKNGYDFIGWTLSSPLVNFPNINAAVASFTMPDNPVTLTANWSQTPGDSFVVTIGNNPGTTATSPRPHDQTPSGVRAVETTQVRLTAGTRAGYTFTRWRVDNGSPGNPGLTDDEMRNNSIVFDMPSNNVFITANWTRNASRITINNAPHTNNVPGQRHAPAGDPQVGTVVTLYPGDRVNDGYRFSHWSFPASGVEVLNAGIGNTGIAQFRMPNFPVTITANWTEIPPNTNPVSIQNYRYGGTELSSLTLTSLSGQAGSGSVHLPYANVNVNAGQITGYRFVRWAVITPTTNNPTLALVLNPNRTSNAINFVMPNEAVVLRAYWEPATNVVNFRHSPLITQGASAPQLPSPTPRPFGDRVYLETPARDNHIFVGWTADPATVNIVNAGTKQGTTQVPAAFFIMPDHRVTITANWQYTGVTHLAIIDPGNGEYAAEHRHAPNAQVIINAGTRPGFTFDRWEARRLSDSAPLPTGVLTNPRSADTTFRMPGHSVRITALWTPIASQLDAPTLVRVDGANITWNPANNAHAYRIYVNGLPATAPRLVSHHGVSVPITALNLGPGVHDIQVRALAGGQNANFVDSELSSPFLRHTIVAPPTAESTRPTGLSLSGATLSWNRVEGATHYFVYVNGVRRSTAIQQPAATAGSPSFNLVNLSPRLSMGGTGYDIQVRAVVPVPGGPTIESHLSEVRVFRDNLPPLPTPTNIRIVGNPTLHWDFPSGNHPNLVGFRIYVDGLATQHMVGPSARSFPIANLGLTSGTYMISVRAVGNGIGNSDSDISTVIQYVSAVLPALNTPINLNIAGHTLTWNAVPGAVGYRIYVNGQPSTAGIVGGLNFNLTQLGLGAGTHLIQVRAIGNNTTHVDSAISAFVSNVLGAQSGNTGNPNTNTNTRAASQHVVSFNPGAGTLPTGEDGLRMGESGFVINSFTNVPTRAGYTFGGWQVGSSGTAVSFPLTVTSDMTLNAIWNRVGDAAATATPAPAGSSGSGTRPNPQTGAFGVLNIVGVVVLTGISIFAVKKISGKKDK